MRNATFQIMGALGVACAHRPAAEPNELAARTPNSEPAAAQLETQTQPLNSESGDPRLGDLEQVETPAPRAEAAEEAKGRRENPATPPAIEPAAPTVATAPPGSAHAEPPAQAASKEEAELRERIQRTLAQDNSLSFTAKRVRIEIDRGRVTLLGEVRTAREKNEVADLVEKVSGVRRVHNRLAIIDQPVPGGAAP
jgi:hypothetical protein